MGVESPGIPGRALEGCLVDNGRYLLRRKIGHTRTTLRFIAQDLVAGLELDLHLHPDPEVEEGYRLGRTAIEGSRNLPDLCGASYPGTTTRELPAAPGSPLRRLWATLRSFFGG